MRKLEVSLVACLIVAVVLATSTLYFYDLSVREENWNKSLKTQIDSLQTDKNSLAAQNEDLEDQYTVLSAQFINLTANYTALKSRYADLLQSYTSLESRYDEVTTNYTSLQIIHQSLQTNYSNLEVQYSSLQSNYTAFQTNYATLEIQYNSLQLLYANLQVEYNDLSDEYAVLQGQYASLFNDHNTLLEAFNEPLFYEEIPTTSELEGWLTTDETDEIWYDYPDFICGDFAVMLSQHAKLEHWDMGVVGVFGYDENYDSYDHAFNVIITTEGLVYVEPQADEVWWYADHEEISEGIWWEFSEEVGYVYVEDYIVILWYD